MFKLAPFEDLGVSATIVLLRVDLLAMPGGGGDSLESLSVESHDLDERLLSFHEQVAATDEVCHRLIAGECTLGQAIAELELINSNYCTMYDAARRMHPDASHQELTARYAIEKVRVIARYSPTPIDDGVHACLEAEFREIFHGVAF